MTEPLKLQCEGCGQLAEVEVNSYQGSDGKRIEWPKAEIRSGRMCFTLKCPTCGPQQKCIVPGN